VEKKVLVTLNPFSLETTIEIPQLYSSLQSDMAFLFDTSMLEFNQKQSGLILPWDQFIKVIVEFSRLLKQNNVLIEFDNLSNTLVEKYLNDRKYFKKDEKFFEITNSNISNLLITKGFKRILTDQQMRNLSRLLNMKHGANFSVPGSGKTTTILALHTILKSNKYVDLLWVVAPINAFISWIDEVNSIFENESIKIKKLQMEDIYSPDAIWKIDSNIYLVNYEKLRKDIKSIIPFFMKKKIHLVLDESHRIKSGVDNLSFQQINRLADVACRRDILSGTPMPQSYLDLDPQFEFLWRTKFISEAQGDDENILKKINHLITSKYVRTTKSEIGLKNPIIEYEKVKLGPIQAELYNLFRSEAARQLSNLDRNILIDFRSIGSNVVRLLQASTNPMLLGTNDDYYDDVFAIPTGSEIWELLNEFSKYERPAKIEYLKMQVKQILDENLENKIVIWSYFIRNIKLLERLLIEHNPVSIYGEIPLGGDNGDYREGRIRRFHNDPSCRLLIANPQACGEGISLHKASHFALYLDRNFNAAYYLQSLDRIHRLGLGKNIDTVIKILVAENTIDEILIKRLNEKTEAMGRVLNDKYLSKLAYDPEDILVEERMGLDVKDIDSLKEHVLK